MAADADLMAATDLGIDICAAAPIHIPGAVQPHALLVGLEIDTLRLLTRSANVDALFPGTALGEVPAWLPRKVLETCRDLARSGVSERSLLARIAGLGRVEAHCFTTPGGVFCEFELATGVPPQRGAKGASSSVAAAIEAMGAARDVAELSAMTAGAVRALSGFERVLVYRFDADGGGDAIGESLAADWPQSFLGLRFPASDIPAQARRLYRLTGARWLPTTNYAPVPLTPGLDAAGQDFDLSLSRYRGVSPVHLIYNRNIDVDGAMSASIIVDGGLWGLFIGHHRRPHRVSAETRHQVAAVTQAFAMRVAALLARATDDETLRDTLAYSAMLRKLAGADDFVVALTEGEPSIVELFPDCTGAAVAWLEDGGPDVRAMGATPPRDELFALTAWIRSASLGAVFATDRLPDLQPSFLAHREIASGVLAIIFEDSRRPVLLLFRPEVLRSVSWAGKPEKALAPDGIPSLPRRSFERWTEMQRGHSRAWLPRERDIASTLRDTVNDVILRQRRRVRDLEAEVARAETNIASLARVGAELQFANTLLTTQMESSPDGVLVVDANARMISFNQRYVEMWRLSRDLLEARDDGPVIDAAMALMTDPQAFLDRIRHFYEHPEEEGRDDLETRDGRSIVRHTRVLRTAAGVRLGRVWFFRDVTDRRQAEIEANRSRDRLQAIFDGVSDGIFIADPTTRRFTEINESGARMLGYAKAELIGGDIAKLSSGMHPYTHDMVLQLYSGQPLDEARTFEWQCRTKNETLLWVEISTRAALFGETPVRLTIMRDISERKRAAMEAELDRERLNKANQQLELGEEIGHFGHFHVDFSTRALRWSKELFRIHGWPQDARQPSFEEAMGLFHPDERATIKARAQLVSTTGGGASGEGRIFRPDGTQRDVFTRIEAERSIDGAIVGVFGIVHDITERKLAEIEANRDRDRFRAIFDAVADGILISDSVTGRFTEMNESGARMFGYDRAELIGCDIGRVSSGVHPYTLEAADEAFSKARLGEVRVFEWQCKTKDDRLFWAEISTRSTLFGDAPVRLAIARDITERKLAEREQRTLRERAEQASQAKSDFLAAMSHEIRTPMNGIIGMNALLLETHLTPDQKKLAETVRYSADALLNVLDDILDVSKLEAGRVKLDDTDFDLSDLVEKTVELLEARAQQKGLSLTAEIDAAGRGAFRGEPTRLRQVLLNLVTNAIKFTERGAVTIAVAGTAVDDDHTCLRIEVRDTGIGIGEEAKQRLFTPFEQADPSIARRFGGTGLGLNISRKLVELMDGRIGIADRPGGGTIFWFEVTLPRASTVDADQGDLEQALETAPVAAASGRILLAEDNRVNVEVATLILETAGYEVDVAPDGIEAVAAVRRRDYDLILMDMQMPGLDGLSATREIRAFERDGKRVPIVAMTANAMAGDRRRCLDAGMDDYVSKPIAPARLRETVARWIRAANFPPGADSIDLAAIEGLPVIDPDVIDTLRSGMAESKFSFLVDFYVADADRQAQQFQTWRSTFTLAEIGDEAHKIIASAGAFGASRVQELAARLQTACQAGDKAALPGLFDRLTRASDAASSALRRMLAS